MLIGEKSGWDSHYRKVKSSVNFEIFRSYDKRNPYTRRMLNFAKNKKRSLEFGSGKGGLSLILKRNYPNLEVNLLDLEKEAIEISKELFDYYGLEAKFYNESFLKLPFPDNYFDFVHGNTVLEHVKDTEKAVKELIRVLCEGGHILVTVPNSYRRFDGHDLYHTINRFGYFSRTFYPKELEGFFKKNSCEIVNRFGVTFIYSSPSYLPRYIIEKLRSRRNSKQTTDIDVKNKNIEANTLNESIYSTSEKKLYKYTFLYVDKIWEPIQSSINQFTDRNEILPSWCNITIGIVARKK